MSLRTRTCKLEDEHAWLEKPFSCNDPSHGHFWHPENWPGAKAPARVDYKETGGVSVSLWVLDSAGYGDLWSRSTLVIAHDVSKSAMDQRRGQIRDGELLASLLEAERDEYYAERRELEEAQLQGMAVPC